MVVSIGRPWSIFTLFVVSAADEGGPTLFLISAAIVMNACSTFVAFLADVSKNGIPSWSAYSWNHCQELLSVFSQLYMYTYKTLKTQLIKRSDENLKQKRNFGIQQFEVQHLYVLQTSGQSQHSSQKDAKS